MTATAPSPIPCLAPPPPRPHALTAPRLHICLLLLFSLAFALASATPYAGSWNDGSRLAAVESLVDRHTWAIDDSLFVRVPTPAPTRASPNWLPPEHADTPTGTHDKLFIHGHYYSDKSPVLSLALAGLYQLLQSTTGLVAAQRPDLFCYLLTVLSSGLAYVAAVLLLYRVGTLLGLPPLRRLALAGSFTLATIAPVYARNVNNHLVLLALVLALFVQALHLVRRPTSRRALLLGLFTGLAYTIDLGTSPILLASVTAWLIFHTRSVRLTAAYALAALPLVLFHHGLNYYVFDTLGPANARLDYLAWPGSPFNAANVTGSLAHPSLGAFLAYTAELLVGRRGFLLYNLPTLASLLAFIPLYRHTPDSRHLLRFAAVFTLGTVLIYTLTSANYGGDSCSIRWFLPLLAPAYLVLALLLRRFPQFLPDLLVLSLAGLPLTCQLFLAGPWTNHATTTPVYWTTLALALTLTTLFTLRHLLSPARQWNSSTVGMANSPQILS